MEDHRHAETEGSTMLPVRPSVWKGGSMASMASWLSRARMAATSRQLERMLSWLSGTPSGAADEPEVNRMAASGDGFRGTTQPSSPASERNVRQAASRRRQGDREAAASSSGSHAALASPAASRRPLPSRRSSRARAVRDMAHPGQTQAMAQIARACGPVQHDRRLSGQQHGQPGHRPLTRRAA